jgi:hypothetical protein
VAVPIAVISSGLVVVTVAPAMYEPVTSNVLVVLAWTKVGESAAVDVVVAPAATTPTSERASTLMRTSKLR